MLNSVRWIGLRSLMRNVHWLNALAAATTIVSFGPSSSRAAKSTAYDTDIVDDRRASGRVTFKHEGARGREEGGRRGSRRHDSPASSITGATRLGRRMIAGTLQITSSAASAVPHTMLSLSSLPDVAQTTVSPKS